MVNARFVPRRSAARGYSNRQKAAHRYVVRNLSRVHQAITGPEDRQKLFKELSPTFFDLIVVAGRAREACLREAGEHLVPGGLIVFDNVDRQRYLDAMAAATDLAVTITRGLTPCLPYPTRTALLRVRPQ